MADEKRIGGVKLILITPDKRFLLIKRNDTKTWDFPGGALEDGEDPKEAALREFLEETGLPYKKMKKLLLKESSCYTQHDGKNLLTFCALSPEGSNELSKIFPKDVGAASEGESDEIRFFSVREIFRFRRNEVEGKEGERIQWGSFKPLLALLDEKGRDQSEKLRENFGDRYGPYHFLRKRK